MTSPLLILFASSVFIGFLATLIVVVAVSVDRWEYRSYDWDALASLNMTCMSGPQAQCQLAHISLDPILVRYDELADKNESSFLYPTQSGLWRVCDQLTDKLRVENIQTRRSKYKGHRCFTFVTDFDEQSVLLNKGFKQIARPQAQCQLAHISLDPILVRYDELADKNESSFLYPTQSGLWRVCDQLTGLQNSAASCYIVALIDLSSAAIVGIIGLVHKQVASCMIAGVLYLMSALFGIFGLSMFHTKDYYEKFQCYSIDEIPKKACGARRVTIGYAVPLAWAGVLTCALASLVWLFVSRVLRVIRAKTVL